MYTNCNLSTMNNRNHQKSIRSYEHKNLINSYCSCLSYNHRIHLDYVQIHIIQWITIQRHLELTNLIAMHLRSILIIWNHLFSTGFIAVVMIICSYFGHNVWVHTAHRSTATWKNEHDIKFGKYASYMNFKWNHAFVTYIVRLWVACNTLQSFALLRLTRWYFQHHITCTRKQQPQQIKIISARLCSDVWNVEIGCITTKFRSFF